MFDDLRGYYFSRYGLAEVLVTEFDVYSPEEAVSVLENTTREEMEDTSNSESMLFFERYVSTSPSPNIHPRQTWRGASYLNSTVPPASRWETMGTSCALTSSSGTAS